MDDHPIYAAAAEPGDVEPYAEEIRGFVEDLGDYDPEIGVHEGRAELVTAEGGLSNRDREAVEEFLTDLMVEEPRRAVLALRVSWHRSRYDIAVDY